jgi:Rps23 Pro-64 3,4-dihydroxylase Tpa1-like proline 4-hydroxylase
MSILSELLRKFDNTLIDQFNDAYLNKKNLDLNGITLTHEPFTHCVISDLVDDKQFVQELVKEMKSKLKFIQKNNDLYKFKQTSDLASTKSTNVSKFRDQVLYGSLLEFLKRITNIELAANKIDVTSSKYEYSDYLLCHDDDIHDVNQFGRRIAFIYYLVPEDWSTDGSDGGNLDLFSVNG